jgi:hypothetical protein
MMGSLLALTWSASLAGGLGHASNISAPPPASDPLSDSGVESGPTGHSEPIAALEPVAPQATAAQLEADKAAREAALAEMASRLDDLAEENEELRERVEFLEDDLSYLDERVHDEMRLETHVGGYVDVGAFFVSGNGSGLRLDRNHAAYPEFDYVPDTWAFLGDPLSTMVNSRGDPASTWDSRAITYDPLDVLDASTLDQRGRSSFVVNAVNLQFFAGLGERATANIMLDALPRTRVISADDEFALGDYMDLKLAYLTYRIPKEVIDVELYAGKFDPVFGYEYRIQEAADRISVTPSLMCRYTCGRPTGVKSRMRFFESKALILNLSATNGSSFSEGFGFSDETDTNHFKTLSGRLSYDFGWGRQFEVGASGAYGAQDLQPDNDIAQWQYGFDLHVEAKGLNLTAEFIQGRVSGLDDPGAEVPICAISACLEYKSAYGLLSYRAPAWFRPYVRVDWRDALHQEGASFVYVSKLIRGTLGLHFDLSEHAAVKAEYTYNRELGDIPQFNNDVVTSSLVGRF